jgi:hypothetical protein
VRDLKRAQDDINRAASNAGCAVRTAERTHLGSTFIEPLRHAAAAVERLGWEVAGYLAAAAAEAQRLPPEEKTERPVYSGRHA